MKALKAFIKPFEAPQRSVKIKIQVNFFILSGIGTLRGKDKKAAVLKTSIKLDIFIPQYNYQLMRNHKFSGHSF